MIGVAYYNLHFDYRNLLFTLLFQGCEHQHLFQFIVSKLEVFIWHYLQQLHIVDLVSLCKQPWTKILIHYDNRVSQVVASTQ